LSGSAPSAPEGFFVASFVSFFAEFAAQIDEEEDTIISKAAIARVLKVCMANAPFAASLKVRGNQEGLRNSGTSACSFLTLP
jgi:hypothetical protein